MPMRSKAMNDDIKVNLASWIKWPGSRRRVWLPTWMSLVADGWLGWHFHQDWGYPRRWWIAQAFRRHGSR